MSLATRCIHVAGALSARGSGVAKAVWELAVAQAALDPPVGVEVVGLRDPDWSPAVAPAPSGVETFAAPYRSPSPPGYSHALARRLEERAGLPGTVVHSHGLWLHPGWAAAAAARRHGAPLFVSPHGMLRRWSFSHRSWKKGPFFRLWERPILDRATCIVCASRAEADDLAPLGLRAPVAVVPFGLDLSAFPHPSLPETPRVAMTWKALDRRHSLGGGPRFLLLGRLHPVKGIEDAVDALGEIAAEHPEAGLVLAGTGPAAYRRELIARAERRGVAGRVAFVGEVAGAERLALLRRCVALILCSRNENFGFVVPEALACGAPAIVSEDVPWEVEREACGAAYTGGAEGLASAMRRILATPSAELRAMGLRGRRWIERDFDWRDRAAETVRLYRHALEPGSEPPEFLRPAPAPDQPSNPPTTSSSIV